MMVVHGRINLFKKTMAAHTKKNLTSITVQLSVGLLLIYSFSFAQDTLKTKNKLLTLQELKGHTQTFYYSQGHGDRAKSIAIFMDDAGTFFKNEVGFTPKIKLYVLAPQNWKEFSAKPLQEVYGFPHNVDNERLVIAAEDNDFWRSLLPPEDQLPNPIAAEITKAYGKPDGSKSLMPFFDLLALHEMGHSYAGQAGLKTHFYWMSELFVNIMLHTYVAEKQPELLPALEAFPNMTIGKGTEAYNYTTLKDFETLYTTLGMGPQNYGWYQSRFHSAAKEIYNSGGKVVLIKLWKALQKHQVKMTDEEFISMLEREVHPSISNVYLEWDKTK